MVVLIVKSGRAIDGVARQWYDTGLIADLCRKYPISLTG